MATVSKTDEGTLMVALRLANHKYADNLMFDETGSNYNRGAIRARGGSVLAFRLNVQSSHGPGHRMTPGMYGRKPHRLRAACWHAYRDFLRELFRLAPTAVVRTSLATYRGAEGFERDFPATYRNNIGSQIEPHWYGTCCECTENAPTR